MKRPNRWHHWPCYFSIILFCTEIYANEEASEGLFASRVDSGGRQSTARSWGQPDVLAVAGRLFRYQLRGADEDERQPQLRVSNMEDESLPTWLEFDKKPSQLVGLPTVDLVGREYIVRTWLWDIAHNHSTQLDVFTIRIVGEEDYISRSGLELVDTIKSGDLTDQSKCANKEPVTMATIVIDTELSVLKLSDRMKLFYDLSEALKITVEALSIGRNDTKSTSHRSVIIAAGPGNARTSQHVGLALSWIVGCGRVNADWINVLQDVETTSRDGSLGTAIGYDIIGWQVTNRMPVALARPRRLAIVMATPTPKPSMGLPSALPGLITFTGASKEMVITDGVIGQIWSKIVHPHPSFRLLSDKIFRTKDTSPIHPTEVRVNHSQSLLDNGFESGYHSSSTETFIQVLSAALEPSTMFPKSVTHSAMATEHLPSRVTMRMSTGKSPFLRSSVREVTLRSGDIFNISVAEYMVNYLRENATTAKMGLQLLREDGRELLPSDYSWIRLNAATRTVYGLPAAEQDGKHRFSVVATDNAAAGGWDSVRLEERFHIRVLHRKRDRLRPYVVSLELENYRTLDLLTELDRLISVASVIATAIYGDPDATTLRVISPTWLEAKGGVDGSFTFAWSNSTLESSRCPADEVRRFLSQLMTSRTRLSPNLIAAFKPARVISLSIRLLGECGRNEALSRAWNVDFQASSFPSSSKSKIATKAAEATITRSPQVSNRTNTAPMIKNSLKRLEVSIGRILNYTVPKDTFYDQEDGDSRHLTLVLQTLEGHSLPRHSWLRFDRASQTLYGLPLNGNAGRYEYALKAIDGRGRMVSDPFEIQVTPHRSPSDRRVNHEFSILLDYDFEKFSTNVDLQIDIASRLATMYGDLDTSKITVLHIAKGTVEFAWTNNSVPYDPCPLQQLTALLSFLVTVNDTINETLIAALDPYRILRIGSRPLSTCSDDDYFLPKTSPSNGLVEVVGDRRVVAEDDLILTIVVPAVVVASLILFIACIACVLYRRTRKGKLSDEDQHTFINRGVPVIFAEEMTGDELTPDVPKKPLVLDDEQVLCGSAQRKAGPAATNEQSRTERMTYRESGNTKAPAAVPRQPLPPMGVKTYNKRTAAFKIRP